MQQNTNIFFISLFQICCKFDGYLFIIVITTHTLGTAIARPAVFVTTIDYINKNFFQLYQKWVIFGVFLMYFFEYLMVLQLILMWFMVIGKILLVYEYVWVYPLYRNIEVFYIFPLYNSYKNMNKTYDIGLKILGKYIKNLFMYSSSSVEPNNTILLCNMYVYMLIYFLKFFYRCESLFIVIFMFCRSNLALFGIFYLCFGTLTVSQILLRKDSKR